MIGYTGDVPSRMFDIVIAVSILLNLFIIFFETFDASAPYIGLLNVIECVTVVIFTIEYILRLLTADFAYPGKKTFVAAIFAFILSLYGIIDLLSFLPYWILMFFPAATLPSGMVAFRMLRVVRILRLFRINRYYDAFNVITDVLRDKKNQIASAVFIILMLVLASSILMYNLEHEAQPDQFRNAFSGIWWAVSTLLTVGYGDIYPVTGAGRFVGIVLAFLGVGIVAIPTGIISAGFVERYTKIRDLEGVIDEYSLDHISVPIDKKHEWCGMKVSDLKLATGARVIAIENGGEFTAPGDGYVIQPSDRVIIASLFPSPGFELHEIAVNAKSTFLGTPVSDIEKYLRVTCVAVKRNGEFEPADRNASVSEGDVIVVCKKTMTGGKM